MIQDEDPPWNLWALCRYEGHPTDWDDTLDMSQEDVQEPPEHRQARHARAKAVCIRCPVRADCEAEADKRSASGIWFGVHMEEWRRDQRGAGRMIA